MCFTSDCNLRDVIVPQKNSGGHGPIVYMQTLVADYFRSANSQLRQTNVDTCTNAYTHRDTDVCMYRREEGNSLKSLSREIVASAALFTRLMPRCTQERVNQARGYTSHPEPRVPQSRSDHSQSLSEPERGCANGGTHRDGQAVYSIH